MCGSASQAIVSKVYPFIQYKSDILHVEDKSCLALANNFETPLYVYSKSSMVNSYLEFHKAFKDIEHIICFAVKANSNNSIIKLFTGLGAGVDTVSMGEIFRALNANVSPRKIVFAGVGKRNDEIEYALRKKILLFNVESESELQSINEIAKKFGTTVDIAIRINPDVNPKTHPHISTGIKESKFGIAYDKALDVYKKARSLKNIRPVGIQFHIGSQILDLSVFKEAIEKVERLALEIKDAGIELSYLDIGGGIGISYKPDEQEPSISELAKLVVPVAKNLGCKLIVEPGRRLVGNAGILLSRVIRVKRKSGKNFYVLDTGMNDIVRPMLYNAFHQVIPVVRKGNKKVKVDIVGPICETGDIIAKDRGIEPLNEGDIVAILSVGAYGFSMSSNYNSRPRSAEVIVDGDRSLLIRQRENLGDLISRETMIEP